MFMSREHCPPIQEFVWLLLTKIKSDDIENYSFKQQLFGLEEQKLLKVLIKIKNAACMFPLGNTVIKIM